ncbi:MAG: hypothetical protein AB7G93_02830 [Bdellovibrionales bacterium]
MSKTLCVIVLSFVGAQAFAGTAAIWKREPLGFTLVEPTNTEDIQICDSHDTCLDFEFLDTADGVPQFREASFGACRISMEQVTHDHNDSSTADQGSLRISYKVIKVQAGNENCKLKNKRGDEYTLTGIYL